MIKKCLLVILIISLFGTAGMMGYASFSLVINGIETNAEVVRVDSRIVHRNKGPDFTEYAATYHFKAASGADFTGITPYDYEYNLPVGHKIEVIYDADNPTTVKVNRFEYLWSEPLVKMIIGIAFTLLCFFKRNFFSGTF